MITDLMAVLYGLPPKVLVSHEHVANDEECALDMIGPQYAKHLDESGSIRETVVKRQACDAVDAFAYAELVFPRRGSGVAVSRRQELLFIIYAK
jgi:hypothetical protein